MHTHRASRWRRAARTSLLAAVTMLLSCAASEEAAPESGAALAGASSSGGDVTLGAAGTTTAGMGSDRGGAAGSSGAGGTSSAGAVSGAGAAAGAAPGTAGAGGASDLPPGAFVHPGILVNQSMLGFVRDKLAQGAEPWKSALAKARASRFASLDYVPHPRETVECGSFSMPDVGCSDEKNDCVAAYTHALLWSYTGDEAHAKKAIQIMNAWSGTIKKHTNSNAPLQSAWVSETFPRAAELIRYSNAGWPVEEAERFGRMLREVYQPLVENGSASNGNWETSMIEATLNIAIYNNDRELFEQGIAMWRERTPAYIYLSSDGAMPVPPPRGRKTGSALIGFWYGQGTLMDGLAQETCRDLSHAQYGFAGIINAAETALIQGVDLYEEEAPRLRAMLEFHAKYINGAKVPSNLCGGSLTDNRPDPMWEIALNHFVTRRGGALPETQKLVDTIRPTGVDHHMAWETLTHAGLGQTGVN